jgi:hypothetical protein
LTLWAVSDGLVLTRALTRPSDATATWITISQTDLRVDLPPWTVAEGFTPVVTVVKTGSTPWELDFSGNGKALRLKLQGAVSQWTFSPSAWGFFPSHVGISGQGIGVTDVQVGAVKHDADLPADPKTILAWPQNQWRNPQREWFAWSGTSVLVLVTADYDIQARYLTRLAYYVEKPGFRGRIASDAEIEGRHGWNAHDYAAADLARFYTQAESEAFPLNGAELELRQQLVSAGILKAKTAHSWDPGTGALVGISLESPPALRAALFVHEAFHGLYYTSDAFREGVRRAWNQLSDGAKGAFRSFLAQAQYDAANEALMINEFQAYLLQRTAQDWAPFLRERVLAAARTLDTLVHGLYGLNSGNVSLVTVLSKPET